MLPQRCLCMGTRTLRLVVVKRLVVVVRVGLVVAVMVVVHIGFASL